MHSQFLPSPLNTVGIGVAQPVKAPTYTDTHTPTFGHAHHGLTFATCSRLCVAFLLRVIVIFHIFRCLPIHCFPGKLLAPISSQLRSMVMVYISPPCSLSRKHVPRPHGRVSGDTQSIAYYKGFSPDNYGRPVHREERLTSAALLLLLQ